MVGILVMLQVEELVIAVALRVLSLVAMFDSYVALCTCILFAMCSGKSKIY
jgi:hypothetical protein